MKKTLLIILIVFTVCFSLSCVTTTKETTDTATEPGGTTSLDVDLDYLEWTYNGLSVQPSIATVGQDVEVSAWIQVPGVVQLPVRAVLAMDGEIIATKEVYLEEDFSYYVNFVVTPVASGTHELRFGVVLERDFVDYVVGKNDLVSVITVVEQQ